MRLPPEVCHLWSATCGGPVRAVLQLRIPRPPPEPPLGFRAHRLPGLACFAHALPSGKPRPGHSGGLLPPWKTAASNPCKDEEAVSSGKGLRPSGSPSRSWGEPRAAYSAGCCVAACAERLSWLPPAPPMALHGPLSSALWPQATLPAAAQGRHRALGGVWPLPTAMAPQPAP